MSSEDFVVMDPDPIRRVELAMEELRAGRMIILVDDEDRENEGDLVIAAQHTTAEGINFMAKEARGLICLSMTGAHIDRLGLPMMVSQNQSAYETAFTVSIEAREGVTTGISAADRAHTILTAINEEANRYDIVTPGHIFPLRARDGGVLERVGQTEGSVDLSRLAGLDPSAVICEVMLDDGTMARLPDLLEFGTKHRILLCSVADIIRYRMQNERIVRPVSEGSLEIGDYGRFSARLYRGLTTDGLHLAVWKGEIGPEPTLVRVQGAPPSWTFLNSDEAALAVPAKAALKAISEANSGVLVFMHLGGLGSDMLQRAFARDFHGTMDRTPLPNADALRDLGAGCQILRDLGCCKLRLLMNSGRAVLGVEAYGLQVEERVKLDV